MELERTDRDGVVVLGLADPVEIDVARVAAFKNAVGELLADDELRVVLDAGNIEFFDSAGMGGLLSLQKRLRGGGGELVLAALNRSVAEVFSMVGFDMVFRIFDDVEQAVAALG